MRDATQLRVAWASYFAIGTGLLAPWNVREIGIGARTLHMLNVCAALRHVPYIPSLSMSVHSGLIDRYAKECFFVRAVRPAQYCLYLQPNCLHVPHLHVKQFAV